MDLHDAAGDGDVVTIRALVAQGANVEAADDDGDRPLRWRGKWRRSISRRWSS